MPWAYRTHYHLCRTMYSITSESSEAREDKVSHPWTHNRNTRLAGAQTTIINVVNISPCPMLVNVGPSSITLAQHRLHIGPTPFATLEEVTSYTCISQKLLVPSGDRTLDVCSTGGSEWVDIAMRRFLHNYVKYHARRRLVIGIMSYYYQYCTVP